MILQNSIQKVEQLEGIINDPKSASGLAEKLLAAHNLPHEARIKVIKTQLGYMEFINHLKLNHKYESISKGFYYLLDEVSSAGARISLKIQTDLINYYKKTMTFSLILPAIPMFN